MTSFMERLEKLKRQGKIKYWGIALGPAIGWREEGVAAIARIGKPALSLRKPFSICSSNTRGVNSARNSGEEQGRPALVARVPRTVRAFYRTFTRPT